MNKKKYVIVLVGLMTLSIGAAATAKIGNNLIWATRTLSAKQKPRGEVNWILPGLRELDPEIFGNVSYPFGFEEDIGVPIGARLTDGAGHFTTTSFPTPFSDNYEQVMGSFKTKMMDRTPIDDPHSGDSAEGEFEWTDPAGNAYYIKVKHVIPEGPAHTFLGGVVIDDYLHGKSSIGTRLMPTVYTYGAFWAIGEYYINGDLRNGMQIFHVMITENVRDEDYELMIDSELTHTGVDTHVMLPPGVTETEYELMPDMTQPFVHVMFENTKLQGAKILQ
ncbi:hypothetical protein GWN63_03935 [Candidatus Bathyarchaeota archaeon]|nr:hypothetical protein [Desulfobacterales bacterium]NIU81380.1 hypothetical protein [Candidatus Bathyarchaeota archaeon]NIV68000.1 hypothetical protein [Candidatus Bathyarchaeota archaeon]NIW34540.1 hypothetical protein [Candidatus Bathyarchaeota archaeon]